MTRVKVKWLDTLEDHDYTAAIEYLSLLDTPAAVKGTVSELKKSAIQQRKAKGIRRATHVTNENTKIPCQLVDSAA